MKAGRIRSHIFTLQAFYSHSPGFPGVPGDPGYAINLRLNPARVPLQLRNDHVQPFQGWMILLDDYPG
jgi:hypothetical protein